MRNIVFMADIVLSAPEKLLQGKPPFQDWKVKTVVAPINLS
jgi:hypothetical protein